MCRFPLKLQEESCTEWETAIDRPTDKFFRLSTLCTHLLWMRIVSAEELYTASGYIIKCSFLNGSAVSLIKETAVEAGSAVSFIKETALRKLH